MKNMEPSQTQITNKKFFKKKEREEREKQRGGEEWE